MRRIIGLSVVLLSVILSSSALAAGTVSTDKDTGKNTGKPVVTTPVKSTPTPDNAPKGLVILNEFYAVDEKDVYVVNEEKTAWQEISGADRATFAVIRGQFAQDKSHAYLHGERLKGADMKTFSVISATNGYSRDAKNVYGPTGLIPEADPETFKMLSKDYSMDAGHVFFQSETIDADAGTFAVIEKGLYATDETKVFYAGEEIENVSPAGLDVDGATATTADGDVYVEGKIKSDEEVDETKDESQLGEMLEPYTQYFTQKTLFWIVLFLAGLGLWSMIFVFFAERNDASASGGKVFLKSLISAIIAGLVIWGVAGWVPAVWAIIIGLGFGAIFFISLMAAIGILRAILVTILSLIVVVCLSVLFALVMRIFVVNIHEFFDIVLTPVSMEMTIIALCGIFLGTLLMVMQLDSQVLRSFIQSLGATLVSLILLGFLQWIGNIGTVASVIIFSVLFAGLLWIMRFRMVSNLFLETVRIVRVALFLAVATGIVIWIIL